MNKKRGFIAVALVAIIAIVALLVRREALAKETTTYRFTAVERGDVAASVSATGTLNAVRTVQIGTQVSGQISELLVDFNDTVKKGQLLARIDPTLQQQAVTDAYAALERAQAEALQAQRNRERNRQLMASGLVARAEFETSDSASVSAPPRTIAACSLFSRSSSPSTCPTATRASSTSAPSTRSAAR